MTSFQQPIGPKADLAELQYVATLHQTCFPDLRKDCSISCADIVLFLRSRYGMQIDQEDALDIIRGLGGTYYGKLVPTVGEHVETDGKFDFYCENKVEDLESDGKINLRENGGKGDTQLNLETNENLNLLCEDDEGDTQSKNLETREKLNLRENEDEDDIQSNLESGENLNLHREDENKEDIQSNISVQGSINSIILEEGVDGEYLDLVQWISALLIPTFVKASQESICDIDRLNLEVGRVQREIAFRPDAAVFDTMWKQHHLKKKLRYLREKQALLVDPGLIGTTLQAMVDSVNVDQTQSPLLTEGFVRTLLSAYGEDSAAEDAELIRQMVSCATNSSDQREGPSIFDVSALTLALTSDILLWETGVEDKISAPFFDVYGFHPDDYLKKRFAKSYSAANKEEGRGEGESMVHGHIDDDVVVAEQEGGDTMAHDHIVDDNMVALKDGLQKWSKDWPKVFSTGPSIDSVVDTHQSIVFLMAVWAYFIFSVTVYMTFLNATNYDIFHCGQGFGCILVNRIWTWFSLGVILAFGGMIIMIPISMANDPYKVSLKSAFVSAITLIIFTVVPYVAITSYKRNIPHGENGSFTTLDRTVSTHWFRVAIDVYLAYGLLLLVFIPKHVLKKYCHREEQIPRTCLSDQILSSDAVRSAGTKIAATRKINVLLKNAQALHLDGEDHKGCIKIMARYLLHEDNCQDAGGLIWCFKMLLSHLLLKEYGIWIQSRLAVAQGGQVLSFLFLMMVLFYETDIIAKQADTMISEVEATDNGLLKDMVLWYIPNGSVIRNSSYVGITFAIGAGIALIITYLPSTASTVLKLRCGVEPSLNDYHFRKYRLAADTTYYNLGNMIYGLVGAQLLFFSFFGGLVFLCTWRVTQRNMIRLLAWFTALMITILLKYFLTRMFRKKFYTAFYRQRPRAGNISSLAMECWHIGLGGGVLVGRLVQFLLASAFWIGRIDVSFLCDDVHIFGYRFDTAPSNFRKELLVHEAHRHPYIDRLGTMYLMRLKHGAKFCSNAGCAWRRLFVQALMPWLLKYRLNNKTDTLTEFPSLSTCLENNEYGMQEGL